jgi:hypothetical protein
MKHSKKHLAKSLEEKRLEYRTHITNWRKANPERAKQHYRNWILKKKGTAYKPRKQGAYYGAFDNLKPSKESGGS